MAYRNFKIIYKNISLKRNVVFVTAYDQHEAYKLGVAPLLALGYENVSSSFRKLVVRTYTLMPRSQTYDLIAKKPNLAVTLEIVNLHFNRKK